MFVKFSEALKMYSAWKKAELGMGKLSSREIAAVRKAYNEGKFEKEYLRRIHEARVAKRQAAARLHERQLLCTPSGTVELNDKRKVHFTGKKFEDKQLHEGKKPSDTLAVINKLREARNFTFKANRALRENDMIGAAEATQQAGTTINSADAVIANSQKAIPENIVAAVQNVKATVDELAVQCGIESPIDTGSSPEAGIPAVNGSAPTTNPTDTEANINTAPVMESKETTKETSDMDAIRERLAKREEALKSMNENFMDDEMKSATAEVKFPFVDKKNSEELVKVSTKKSKEAADTWPTEKIEVKETKSASEQMVDEKLNEADNNWSFEKIMKEGILG